MFTFNISRFLYDICTFWFPVAPPHKQTMAAVAATVTSAVAKESLRLLPQWVDKLPSHVTSVILIAVVFHVVLIAGAIVFAFRSSTKPEFKSKLG